MNKAERSKTVTLPGATHGKPTVRQAYEGTVRRGWKKQMPSGNQMDRICNMI
jgi:hypothetical protein